MTDTSIEFLVILRYYFRLDLGVLDTCGNGRK